MIFVLIVFGAKILIKCWSNYIGKADCWVLNRGGKGKRITVQGWKKWRSEEWMRCPSWLQSLNEKLIRSAAHLNQKFEAEFDPDLN